MEEYLGIVNIDYHDAILGTPFLEKYKVIIDFIQDCFKIKDKIIFNQVDGCQIIEGKILKRHFSQSTENWEIERDHLWLSLNLMPDSNDKKGEIRARIENICNALVILFQI